MTKEFIISTSTDVYFNLALEEYIVRNYDLSEKEVLLIYINSPSVVLGKNQNILREINYKNYLDSNLTVARRISGGGTVVHDLGNINFSFFEAHDFKKINSYQSSTARLVEVINKLGVDCYLNPRNAIFLANEKKISGSAQFSCSNGILSHFTILFNSNQENIRKILSPNYYKIETKASQSIPSETDNLANYLNLSQVEFIQKTIEILGYDSPLDLTELDLVSVTKLRDEKYSQYSYFYDTSCNGLIIKDKIEIEIESGKIKYLKGIDDNFDFYIGKRLLYSEIDYKGLIWNLIF